MPPDQPTPPEPPRHSPAQRRSLTVAAGLVVLVLAGGAFAVTYDVLRGLALTGGVARRWAPAYPVMADALLVIVVLSLIVTRHARWWSRTIRWVLLLALLAGGAAIGVQHAVWGLASLPADNLKAGVAVAPHAMLIISVWLWLTMFKQLRTPRPAPARRRRTAKAKPVPVPEPAPAPEAEHPPAVEPVAEPEAEPEPVEPTPEPQDTEHDPDRTDPHPLPPASLPTDVELVRHRPDDDKPQEDGHQAGTTQPDLVMPVTLDKTAEVDDPEGEVDAPLVDRAEDPDGGDDEEHASRGRHRLRDSSGEPSVAATTDPDGFDPDDEDLPIWDWNPPSGKFRSSPTPPAD